MIGISPCSRDVFTPFLNKLVYVLDSLMAGHYNNTVQIKLISYFHKKLIHFVTTATIMHSFDNAVL